MSPAPCPPYPLVGITTATAEGLVQSAQRNLDTRAGKEDRGKKQMSKSADPSTSCMLHREQVVKHLRRHDRTDSLVETEHRGNLC